MLPLLFRRFNQARNPVIIGRIHLHAGQNLVADDVGLRIAQEQCRTIIEENLLNVDNQLTALALVKFSGQFIELGIECRIAVTGTILRVITIVVGLPVPGEEDFRVTGIGRGDVGNQEVIFALDAHLVNEVIVNGLDVDVKAEFLKVGLHGFGVERQFGTAVIHNKVELQRLTVLIADAVAIGIFPACFIEELRSSFRIVGIGVSQLSESELLAIIIGNGPKEFPTVDLMNQMLDDCGNDLSKLGKKTMEELMCYRGIGKNRAIAIVAACEFGKRFRKTAPEEKPVLKNALAVGTYMIPQLEDLDVEEFWALFLNPKHELLRRVRICRGEVSENAADPRNIMRFGVLYNATYIVTVHNHISGNPSPTKFDSIIAARLTKSADSVRMTLRDHIILADEQYYSFAENKKL